MPVNEAVHSVLLQVRDLALYRGDRLLFSGLDLQLNEREILQLQGSNGAGKTTLLRALCGLVRAEKGEMHWRGVMLPAAREQFFSEVLYAGHSDGINGDLTAAENLIFAAKLRDAETSTVTAALQRVGLSAQADLPCRVLSAGQKRRVGLARLLVCGATLWLLDEPLTALDIEGRRLVESILCEQIDQGGAVIFTTHQPLSVDGCNVRTLAVG